MTRRGSHVPHDAGPMYAAAARRAPVIVTLTPTRKALGTLIAWPLHFGQPARVQLRTGNTVAVRPNQIELITETAA